MSTYLENVAARLRALRFGLDDFACAVSDGWKGDDGRARQDDKNKAGSLYEILLEALDLEADDLEERAAEALKAARP